MGSTDLIDSLRETADEKVRLMRQEAEREAKGAKDEVARRLEQLLEDAKKKETLARGEADARAAAAANERARTILLSAEEDVSRRLKEEAEKLLPSLRRADYETLFGAMARELPGRAWKTVRVNPADMALAGSYFADAEIVSDASITGGMDAASEDGRIRVVNTFEKRLERAWDEMLPLLIRDVYQEVSNGAPATH